MTSTFLYGVSCGSASSCTAVGSYSNSANVQVPLAESWDGSTWTVQATPTSRFKNGGELLAVSCPAPGLVYRGGELVRVWASNGGLLVEHSSAGTWHVQSVQAPSGTTGAELDGISCIAAASCTAVGDYTTVSGTTQTTHPLAESWDGSTWAIQSVPGRPGTPAQALESVSCVAKANCTATGIYLTQSPGPGIVAVAYQDFGGTWLPQATASPASQKVLAGHLRTAPSSCVAVGWHRHGLYQPLAEQR